MTDIVDDLRENWPNMTDAFEAADEIERLRAELAAETKARKAYADEWPRLVAERDALRAELAAEQERVANLRIALSALAKHCNGMEAQNHDYHALAEGGQPRLSEPLANAYDMLSIDDDLLEDIAESFHNGSLDHD